MSENGSNGAGAPGASGAGAPAEAPAPENPAPEFELTGVEPVERAAAPTLRFTGEVTDASGRPVYMIALSAVVSVEPAKRSYTDAERERLVELFGAPERWATTTSSFRWVQADVVVPGFRGEGRFEIPLACTYDMEVASAKYFGGLEEGEVPLRFDFNGTVFYEGAGGGLQLLRIPWDRTERFSMPVATWKRMIADHFPHRGWVALDPATISSLGRIKAERGLPDFDAAVRALIEGGE